MSHGGLISQHFTEWWGYGVFFAAAATAQTLFGLAILTRALDGIEVRYSSVYRAFYMAGIVGNAALLGMYFVSRTIGIPSGPSEGEVEPVAIVDLVTKVLEVGIIVLCWRELRLISPPRTPIGRQ